MRPADHEETRVLLPRAPEAFRKQLCKFGEVGFWLREDGLYTTGVPTEIANEKSAALFVKSGLSFWPCDAKTWFLALEAYWGEPALDWKITQVGAIVARTGRGFVTANDAPTCVLSALEKLS